MGAGDVSNIVTSAVSADDVPNVTSAVSADDIPSIFTSAVRADHDRIIVTSEWELKMSLTLLLQQ